MVGLSFSAIVNGLNISSKNFTLDQMKGSLYPYCLSSALSSVHTTHSHPYIKGNWHYILLLFSVIYLMLPSFRYSQKSVLLAHFLMGAEHVWHLLHPCSPWTLFHWRFHCILHHVSHVPLLPLLGQQPCPPTEGFFQDKNLVSNV